MLRVHRQEPRPSHDDDAVITLVLWQVTGCDGAGLAHRTYLDLAAVTLRLDRSLGVVMAVGQTSAAVASIALLATSVSFDAIARDATGRDPPKAAEGWASG